MTTKTIVGIDVSKLTLDAHCWINNEFNKVDNNSKGFNALTKWFKQIKVKPEQLHIVFEYTGMYNELLENWLIKSNIMYSIVPGLQIKNSLGIIRGKTDQIDARRIAEYAVKNPEKLRIVSTENRELINRLQSLSNYRDKLVAQRAGYKSCIEDSKTFKQLTEKDSLIHSHRQMITHFTDQIQKIEKEITALIKSEPGIKRNYELLLSIKGVGPQTALQTIIFTGNFTKFETARRFASFCGTAPFPYTSGTSIKRKTKISRLANRKMKSTLYMAAGSAIQHDPELKAYYQKRIQTGKNEMSTINVIKNKLIGRMFAVIERQTPFVVTHKFAA